MAKTEWNQKAVEKAVANVARGKLDLIGQFVKGAAKINVTNNKTVNTGNLRNSMQHKVIGDRVIVFNTAFYAPSVELGNRAILSKYLTIPISKAAEGKRAREFTDSFVKKFKGNLYIVRKNGKKLEFLYLLKKETRPYPFLRPALFNNINNIRRIAKSIQA